MAATSGMATLGRLGPVLEQPEKSAAAASKMAVLSLDFRMKNMPDREIRISLPAPP
jgi:hypothetical protein